MEESLISPHRKRRLGFFGRFLPDQVSAEAADEPEVKQGRRRHHRGGGLSPVVKVAEVRPLREVSWAACRSTV